MGNDNGTSVPQYRGGEYQLWFSNSSRSPSSGEIKDTKYPMGSVEKDNFELLNKLQCGGIPVTEKNS